MNNKNNKMSKEELDKIMEAALESGKEPAEISPERMDRFTWNVGDLQPVERTPKRKRGKKQEGKEEVDKATRDKQDEMQDWEHKSKFWPDQNCDCKECRQKNTH